MQYSHTGECYWIKHQLKSEAERLKGRAILARLYPFLERQNADGISLLFSPPDFLNVLFLTDIQKVWRIVWTLSLLFTFPVSKMDKVELRGCPDKELQEIAREMNWPAGLNLEKFADDLRRVANDADAVKAARGIIAEAKARNGGKVF